MKFPENSFLLTALMEEVGELARAYLQGQGENRVRAEALQVACVALRIYEESDPVYAAMTKEQQKA
jgi:NTP pyrophosphatase (non-canonical NTP hydrolase)